MNNFAPNPVEFVQKSGIVSLCSENAEKIKYVHNVLEYKPRQITPQKLKALFVDGKLGDNYLKDEMRRIKRKLFFSSFTNINNFKKWKNSVKLSSSLSAYDLQEISDFMNMHNCKYIHNWYGYSPTDNIPNLEKLALFVRCIKRIDKLNFYKNLSADDWENCIDGIIRKPQEVVRALMEYKLDSRKINNAISYGTNSEKVQSQIKAIEKFLNSQSLRHGMTVYRGEGGFGIFSSIKFKNITLKDKLEELCFGLDKNKFNKSEFETFTEKYIIGKKVVQERFLSTAIEKEAGDKYAKKVFWNIYIPPKTKCSIIESYNIERESEAELLIQKNSSLLIYNAKYDKLNKRLEIWAFIEQP